jgi:hypothetical protein
MPSLVIVRNGAAVDEARDEGRLRLRPPIVGDQSRLAYVELHPDERAATVTAFLERGLAGSPSSRTTASLPSG